jgi:hypothetical protein
MSYYDTAEYHTLEKMLADMRTLRSTGFQCNKLRGGRRILTERSNIVAARTTFPRRMKTINEGRLFLYLDETWVNQNHSLSK